MRNRKRKRIVFSRRGDSAERATKRPHREERKGEKGADTTPAGEFEGGQSVAEGAQVAQHGGEMGEANDWCRLHGLALQLSVFPS